ncbi:RNA polymerase sigma factor [Frigoribacterium sp. 2-23]|uniref:RNA polymerase sigma factor n=1 Tax=Frigoribacterium sp. 2-23 TaxID=3415006 RepID=UPI003C6EB132
MGAESTDKSLWQRSLDGDSDAFGALFIEHRDRVYRHAYRLTSAVQDAEDVTATAFLELWRRRESVRTVNGSVLAWLLITATNTARNISRKTARYDQLLRSLPRTEPSPGADQQHEDTSLVASLDPALLATLRRLPPQDLTLLTLVTFEGLTVAEVATELGLTETGARTRLHRARMRLRRHPSLNPTLTSPAATNIEGITP